MKSLLEDGALSTIQGLPLIAANYKTAIDLLTEHFGRKSVIVSSHMDSLLKLPSLFNCNDVRKLRQLYDTIEVHISGLQSLDVSSETYGMLLVPALFSKIPEEIRLMIGRKVKDDTWDLDTLITNLKEEIDARESAYQLRLLLSMHQRNKVIPVTINNPAVPQHYIYLTTEAQVVASVAINMHHKIVLMLQVFKPERKYLEMLEDVLCASEKIIWQESAIQKANVLDVLRGITFHYLIYMRRKHSHSC